MFDFYKFYQGLLERADEFNPSDKYWSEFPQGMCHRFISQTLGLLKENAKNKDSRGLACTLWIILHDGADNEYTDVLISLLYMNWHSLKEDIVEVLELIKDPKSVDALYDVAINVPDYDEMRALAKKCIWALRAIGTPEAINKLRLLQQSGDEIISENATFQLEHIAKKN